MRTAVVVGAIEITLIVFVMIEFFTLVFGGTGSRA